MLVSLRETATERNGKTRERESARGQHGTRVWTTNIKIVMMEGERSTEIEKESRILVVSMAPKRRGVYVVSADVSFLLANKASL